MTSLGPALAAQALPNDWVTIQSPFTAFAAALAAAARTLAPAACPAGILAGSSSCLAGPRMSVKVSLPSTGTGASLGKGLPAPGESARSPTTHSRGLFWGTPCYLAL